MPGWRSKSWPDPTRAIRSRFADACARAVGQFFTEYDCLLTPTTACVSWPVEQVYPKMIENREAGPRVNTEQERSGEVLNGPAAHPLALADVGDRSGDRLKTSADPMLRQRNVASGIQWKRHS